MKMKKGACHMDKLVALKRIEGQVRGVMKMIEDGRYCVDIINAIGAAAGALKRVEAQILKDHLGACVKNSFSGGTKRDVDEKIAEIVALFRELK